jgi:outer membrane protein assembly factor BamB
MDPYPPSPFDPLPDLPLYTPDGVNFFYDDRDFDYATYSANLTANAGGREFEADDSGPPSPGGSGGGSSTPPFISQPDYDDATCPGNFWLVISNSPNTGQVFVGITNTVPGVVYNLLTNANLANSNGWQLQQSLTATSSITWAAPTTITGTSNLFFTAQIAWPTLLWVTTLTNMPSGDQWGNGIDSSPTLSMDGNHVYVVSTGNTIYSLDAATGAIEFTNHLTTENGELTSSPAVATNGNVLVGSFDAFLFSFTSNLIGNWTNNLSTNSDAAVYATPAITTEGKIYVGTDEEFDDNATDSGFFSFNMNSNKNWFLAPPDLRLANNGDVESSAAVGPDGIVYFLAEDDRLYALYTNGAVKWFLPVPGHTEPDSSPGIGPDGTIYVGSDSGYLYAVSPDGSLKWTFDIPTTNLVPAIYSSPVIDSNATVYVGAAQQIEQINNGPVDFFPEATDLPGGVYAINQGKLLWAFTNVPGWIVGSVALAEDGTVYAGAASSNHTFGILYAITNGMQKWAYQTSNDIVSSPVICSDGSIIVTCEDSNVYKFAGCSPLAESFWPMFHHDPQHTGSLAGTNDSTPSCTPPFPNDGLLLYPEFIFSATGTPGSSWSVYASTNLLTNWTNTGVVLTLDSTGSNSFTDSGNLANNVFYYLSNECCSRVIGFTAFTAQPGTNLIADPFYQVDDEALNGSLLFSPAPMNTVGALFTGDGRIQTIPGVPEGVNVIGWNGHELSTNTCNGDRAFLPSGDIPLLPGNGAILNMGSSPSQLAWFAGIVPQAVTNQVVPGTNFLGSALPIAGGVSTVLGYTNAAVGDWLQKWDPTNGVFITYTNNGGTNWYRSGTPNEPYIGLAEGFILFSDEITNRTWIQTFSPCESN